MLAYFYPRSPCGERLRHAQRIAPIHTISIHALLAESDKTVKESVSAIDQFLSTLSLRRATHRWAVSTARTAISIHALLAESDAHVLGFGVSAVISIHALLAESDAAKRTTTNWLIYFYPRSPCGERRYKPAKRYGQWIFLSTLSLRRATPEGRSGACIPDYFYPRSPCGERHAARLPRPAQILISIHALLAESDPLWQAMTRKNTYFYPRSTCGERRR